MKRIIRLTESDLARIVRRVIKEQTTPSLGIAQGNKVPLQNVSIEGIGKGELTVMDETNINTGTGSVSYPELSVISVKYVPPMTLVSKDPKNPNFGKYKNDKGETIGNVSKSSAAAKVILGLSFGNFTFNLNVYGGDNPSLSASGFNEVNPEYSFVMGTSVVTGPNRNEFIKNGFGKSDSSQARLLTNTIFGGQSWVTNLQKVLPQS
jgi:hypothetical protein